MSGFFHTPIYKYIALCNVRNLGLKKDKKLYSEIMVLKNRKICQLCYITDAFMFFAWDAGHHCFRKAIFTSFNRRVSAIEQVDLLFEIISAEGKYLKNPLM